MFVIIENENICTFRGDKMDWKKQLPVWLLPLVTLGFIAFANETLPSVAAKDNLTSLSKGQLRSSIRQARLESSNLKKAAQSLRAVSTSLASLEASSSQARAASEAAQSQAQASQATSQSQVQSASSVVTGQEGKIIGNIRTKIYHVPGQAGYSMSSKNAVYFNTEAEAQAAGYRKSQR